MPRMIMKRRHVLWGMAASTMLPRIGFGQAATDPVPGGTLRISHAQTVLDINPLTLSGSAEYVLIDMVYSRLTRMGRDSLPHPDLADRWEANADATEFTYFLRAGVTFHDGTPLTSDDVVATYEAILNPDVPAAASTVLSMITSVEAVDELTVKFVLAAPFADLPFSTAHANTCIVQRKALETPDALATGANGTGPFKLESHDSAQLTRVVKNEAYFVPGKPYLDAVELVLFPDLAAETANFLSGDTDVMLNVEQTDFERIAGSAGVTAGRTPSGTYVCVVMRQDAAPWSDVKVRKALSLATDRQLLLDVILEGLGRPAYDSIVPPELEFATEKPEISYDPEAAKALLAEAGFPDGLDVKLVCSERPAVRVQAGIALQQSAKAAGFNIEIETMPHDTYLANVWMKGPFYIGYWGMQATIDATYRLLLTSDASYQDTEWKNAEFDALLNEGRATIDPAERARIYAEAQALELRDTPYIVPYFEDNLTASDEDTQGWSGHPLGRFYFIEDVWKTA